MEFEIEAILVVLGLVLCPMVLLLLVSILIASLMATYTFLRDWQKPATQIDRQDLPEPPMQMYARNTLMGLPAELRLIIYEFTLQDNINTIALTVPSELAPLHNSVKKPTLWPPFRGGLALCQTNRTIRTEALFAYPPLMKSHHKMALEAWKHLTSETQRAIGHEDREIKSRAGSDAWDHEMAMTSLSFRILVCKREWFDDAHRCYEEVMELVKNRT
jgi:hypothetical protein